MGHRAGEGQVVERSRSVVAEHPVKRCVVEPRTPGIVVEPWATKSVVVPRGASVADVASVAGLAEVAGVAGVADVAGLAGVAGLVARTPACCLTRGPERLEHGGHALGRLRVERMVLPLGLGAAERFQRVVAHQDRLLDRPPGAHVLSEQHRGSPPGSCAGSNAGPATLCAVRRMSAKSASRRAQSSSLGP